MAVPKKRTGHSAQGHRRSNWKATKPEVTTCANCGQPVLTHTVCSACGYYKGKAVSIKSPDYVEAGAEAKKVAKKKTTKKAEAVEKKTTTTEVIESKEAEVKDEKKETKAKKSTTAKKKSTTKKTEDKTEE